VRFTIDATTPATPVPKKSEAWPGGEILKPNKEAALAAFHSRKCRTAAATAAAAAAAAARAVEPWPHTPDRCVFFFSHEVGEFACLSQFFHAEFTDETGQNYSCMEQYMMAEKAQAMGDEASRALLLAAGYNPGQYKALGRQISPWVQQVWDDVRESVVTRGNILKFSQDAALGNVLLSTGDLILAEAAENDRIWGIGLNIIDAQTGLTWRGLNLLGKCLMAAREELARRAQWPVGAARPSQPQPPAAAGGWGAAAHDVGAAAAANAPSAGRARVPPAHGVH